MPVSDQEVERRARDIFLRENEGNKQWGQLAFERQNIGFNELEGPNAVPLTLMSPEERARYIERARKELEEQAEAERSAGPSNAG